MNMTKSSLLGKMLLVGLTLLGNLSLSKAADVLTDMVFNETTKAYYRVYSESGTEATTPYVLYREYNFMDQSQYLRLDGTKSNAWPNGFTSSVITNTNLRNLIIKDASAKIWEDLTAARGTMYLFFKDRTGYGVNAEADVKVTYDGPLANSCITDFYYIANNGNNIEITTINELNPTHDYAESATNTIRTRKNTAGMCTLYRGARIFLPKAEYEEQAAILIPTVTYSGMEKITSGVHAGQYGEVYSISATLNGAEVDVTLSGTGSLPYTIAGQKVIFNEASNATLLTVTAGTKTATVEIPASNGRYIKAATYDLTQKSTYITSLVNGNPTNTSTTVNGFSDTAPRYALPNERLMMANGLYANTPYMVYFVGYGLTCSGTFNLNFLNHEDGFVYVYQKKMSNSAAYADAVTVYQKSTAQETANLDQRGISIYTALDVYAPEGATTNIVVSDAGYATYSSPLSLAFDTNTAHIITPGQGTSLVASPCTSVAGRTALLIKGNTTAYIQDIEATTDDVSGNLLQPQLFLKGNYTLAEGNGNNYVLGKQNEILAFYWVGSNAADISYGKAWLQTGDATSNSKKLNVTFADTKTTRLSHIKTQRNCVATANTIYNIQGQRMLHPSRGLYIINGKKIVVE